MIKQIQLRGISRTPSDRTVEDGGCAESLNIHLDNGESAPTLPPDNITPGGLAATGAKILYIHKGEGFTNYVGVVSDSEHTYLKAYYATSSTTVGTLSICELPAGVSVVSATSIGRILIVSLSNDTARYALFVPGNSPAYKYLGDKVPVPQVSFSVTPQTPDDLLTGLISVLDINDGSYGSALYSVLGSSLTTKSAWETLNEWADGLAVATTNQEIAATIQAQTVRERMNSDLWERIDADVVKNRADKKFSAPVLARYALRLYDGSYIYLSSPVLLAGSTKNMTVAEATFAYSTNGWFELYTRLNHVFKAGVTISLDGASNWEELIESVDIFLSQDIHTPKPYAKLKAAQIVVPDDVPADFTTTDILDYARANYDGIDTYRLDTSTTPATVVADAEPARDAFEEDMLEKSNFYLVKSYRIGELPSSPDELSPYAQDDLVVKPTMPGDDGHFVSATGTLANYNNRVLSVAQLTKLSAGHSEPHALVPNSDTTTTGFAIVYYVRDAAGNVYTVHGYIGDYVSSQVRGFVSYPDPRCFRAELYKKQGQVYPTFVSIPMKEHPRLNCSYGFIGLDNSLWSIGTPAPNPDSDDFLPSSKDSYLTNNRLALSEMDNPFVFPLAQRQSFQSEIIEAVPVTIALSTGQFGQFPLYVFCVDGIWTVSINDEGGLAAAHPVSRDVAIPGTICQLDQAIAFVTKQGVMIITGSDPVNISPYMNGRHYALDTSIATALASTAWAGVVAAITESTPTPFMAFAKDSQIAYDYAGRRLLLLNKSKSYQYVYMLDTQTWHKIAVSLPEFVILNSFPECMVSTYASSAASLLDFSTVLDNASLLSDNASPVRGLIVTRSLDLGQPDVRKALKDLRIRGRFNKGDVKYMMLGSFDGIKWTRLLTKGGGSYNLFRLVILTNLSPTERISWIDVEFEPRFANKLR